MAAINNDSIQLVTRHDMLNIIIIRFQLIRKNNSTRRKTTVIREMNIPAKNLVCCIIIAK